MDNIQKHLDAIPIATIAIAAVVMLLAAMVVPKKIGFYASIFLMFAWINLDRFKAIPYLPSAAKVTYWLPPLLLIFFASFLPGPRRQTPILAWVYMISALFGVVCVSGAVDFLYGMVQFSTMFLYSAAAIALYRVTITNQQLVKVIVAMFLGIVVPIAVAFSALVIFRGSSFRPGVARFEPFGVISNQYVHLFATGCCFASCGFMLIKTKWMKLFCLAVIAACGAMLIASGSRQGLVIVSIAMLPSIRWGIKHPIGLAIGVAGALAAGVWVFAFTEDVGKTARITDFSHTSGRFDTAKEYVNIILARPVGLLGTTGHKVNRDETASRIPHNSYLKMGYLGGLLLALPLFFVWIKSLYAILYVVVNKKKIPFNETLLVSLAVLLLAIYVQGLVSDMIYLSVSSWTFLHYFLSCFFMGLARDIKQQQVLGWQLGEVACTR